MTVKHEPLVTGILTQEETVRLIMSITGFKKLLTEAELGFVERALGIAYSLGFAAGIEQGFERSLGLLRKLEEKRRPAGIACPIQLPDCIGYVAGTCGDHVCPNSLRGGK